MALKQACSTDCHRAQGAFKDSMIHGILQFTLPIAFRCVLHRWENQEIRCRKLYYWLLASYGPTISTFIQPYEFGRNGLESQASCEVQLIQTVHTGLWILCKVGRQRRCTRVAPSVWLALAFTNDPSAGSPTETLLRLLLPLNDQVCLSFQRPATVAGTSCQSQRLTKPFNR